MTAAAWSAIGVMVAAGLAFAAKALDRFFDWLSTRSNRGAQLDSGVRAAADTVVSTMTGNYEWIAGQLTSLQAQLDQVQERLDEVTRDRDGLVRKLDRATRELEASKAENAELRKRVEHLEANAIRDRGVVRDDIARRKTHREGEPS